MEGGNICGRGAVLCRYRDGGWHAGLSSASVGHDTSLANPAIFLGPSDVTVPAWPNRTVFLLLN